MRIAVFGAAGNVGSRVVTEAAARGHEVTAVVRNPSRAPDLPATIVTGDVSDSSRVAALGAGHDLVVTATRPAPGREPELVATTEAVLAGLRGTGIRLLVVGGAASLTVPGTGGATVVEDPGFPAELRGIALACARQFELCLAEREVDWTYLSPPGLLEPGPRTGRYRLGRDELVVDGQGVSAISMEDFAVALLDEAENPRHRGIRFTVAY
ncbi:NAD-dependent epimerase/dehydratase family protein [Amycolatopsis rhizosphaerae]|uniref:NAD-dependent epimerase/dehydratase family protein n=1 Tax=Amycolatopsis rhizosphaerae TaxID=2053003 RepID=A0A558CWQ0_9PSEU|nr:NAD(P)H-binding protein [Amycolatopsis rhizosphaerae]TVT53201.1 NAD-dependent epimerase/dehydratase family protein [Amycolatopsis rhizosphaerae]